MGKQPEYKIASAIRKEIKARGGFAFKVHGSEYMLAGLPDIVACFYGRFLAFEVKTPVGELSKRQEYILTRIERAGGITGVPRSLREAQHVLDEIEASQDNTDDA